MNATGRSRGQQRFGWTHDEYRESLSVSDVAVIHWREGGENGSDQQFLDREVARTKTKVGGASVDRTVNTQRVTKAVQTRTGEGEKRGTVVRGIPLTKRDVKGRLHGPEGEHTGRGD